jgi:hypothetical protein
MFRIKTDIRTYECESRERVERLIRNWVVRPTDLVFYDDREEWAPIGEHPAFSETFAEMAERDEDVPETQVVDEDDDTEDDEEGPGGYTPDLSGLGTFESDDDPRDAHTQSGSSVTVGEADASSPDESTQVSPSPYVDSGPGSHDASEADDPAGETAEMAAPAPDVEPASNDAETFESSTNETSPAPSPRETGAEVTADDGSDLDASEGPDDEDHDRGDLPDDLLTTHEMSASPPERHEGMSAIDGPESGASPPAADPRANVEKTPSTPSTESVEVDYQPREADELEDELQRQARDAEAVGRGDDEWDEIMETLRETDELDKREIEQISETRDELTIGRDDADDEEDEDVPDESREYGSEGYDLELPIEIGPSPRDRQLGLRPTRASETRKDRTFPKPSAKREGDVLVRTFELETPRDLSLIIVAAFFAMLVLLVAAAIVFVGM